MSGGCPARSPRSLRSTSATQNARCSRTIRRTRTRRARRYRRWALTDVWVWPRATVVDHHDGDTFYADVDLGRRTSWLRGSIRLARINAPELYLIVQQH